MSQQGPPEELQQTMKEFLGIRKEMGNELGTFLSMDTGKYGSDSFTRRHYFNLQKDVENFVSRLYRNKMSVTEWENVVDMADSGYVAKVQAIVARAKCILFVGGGAFQKLTLHLYQQLHPDPSDRCVSIVKKCTSSYRLSV